MHNAPVFSQNKAALFPSPLPSTTNAALLGLHNVGGWWEGGGLPQNTPGVIKFRWFQIAKMGPGSRVMKLNHFANRHLCLLVSPSPNVWINCPENQHIGYDVSIKAQLKPGEYRP